jgi:hypothetical protein
LNSSKLAENSFLSVFFLREKSVFIFYAIPY